jgi:hypothetical protein
MTAIILLLKLLIIIVYVFFIVKCFDKLSVNNVKRIMI